MRGLVAFLWLLPLAAGQCNFISNLIGTWTTTWSATTTGTFIFGDGGSFYTPRDVLATGSGLNMTCLLSNDTVYVLKSDITYEVFQGVEHIFIYMCIDIRAAATDHAYYFYLNANKETGFNNLRLRGLTASLTVTSMAAVCNDSTLDQAEYHTMVRTGSEASAVHQLPDILLGNFWYTFTDATGTVCDNTTLVDVCNNNFTHFVFNESSAPADCVAKEPMFSENGVLANIVSFTKTLTTASGDTTTIHYITVYNLDTTVDGSTTYRFACMALTSSSTTTERYISLNPTACVSGQSPQTRTTDGVLLVLTPFYTCLPTTMESQKKDFTVLIIVICVIVVIFVLCGILLCFLVTHKRSALKSKAREKMILITESHPLAENSMALDVPMSLEPVSDNAFLETRDEVYKVPREPKKNKGVTNPLSESSLNLDFKDRTWAHLPGPIPHTIHEEDPFNGGINGGVPGIDPVGSKMARSMRSTKPKAKPFVRSFSLKDTPRGRPNGDLKRYRSVGSNLGMSFDSTGDLNDTDILSSYSSPRHNIIPKAPKSTRSVKTTKASPRRPDIEDPITPKASTPAPAPSVVPSVAKEKKAASRLGARSVTSTKIGSVTSRAGNVSPRKSPRKMKRSKTTIVTSKSETEADTDAAAEMEDFMKAEMNNWTAPDTASQFGATDMAISDAPKKSKTAKSNASKSTVGKAKRTRSLKAKSIAGSLKAKSMTRSLTSGDFAKSTTSSKAKVRTPRRKSAATKTTATVKKAFSHEERPSSALLNASVTLPSGFSTPKTTESAFLHYKREVSKQTAYTPRASKKPWH